MGLSKFQIFACSFHPEQEMMLTADLDMIRREGSFQKSTSLKAIPEKSPHEVYPNLTEKREILEYSMMKQFN
jgi:hypothetical protein